MEILPAEYEDYDGLVIGSVLRVTKADGWMRNEIVRVRGFLSDGRLLVKFRLPVQTPETVKVAEQLGLDRFLEGTVVLSRLDVSHVL